MAGLTFEAFLSSHRQRVEALYESSGAKRWSVSLDDFARAAWQGVGAKASISSGDIPQLLKDLRTEDLALALGCAQGNEEAWRTFRWNYGTTIYEAACALVPDLVQAREIADSLMAELYGVDFKGPKRLCRLLYFHGRSSLKTWLRAVLYQEFVDEYRRRIRLEPLPDDVSVPATDAASVSEEDDRRYADLLAEAVSVALRELPVSERFLLSCYYVQQLTLKQIGRLRGEHEATASRHLESLRKKLRKQIEHHLRKVKKLGAYDVERCLDFATRGVTVNLEKALKPE